MRTGISSRRISWCRSRGKLLRRPHAISAYRKQSPLVERALCIVAAVFLHQLVDEGFCDIGGDAELLVDQRTGLEDGLGVVCGGNVGALEEDSDGNLVAPKERFFDG